MAETYTLAALLADVTTILTSVVSWIGTFVQVICSNPLLLLFVVIGVAGVAIGFINRLIRV